MSFTCSFYSRLCLQSNRCFRGKSAKPKKVRFKPAHMQKSRYVLDYPLTPSMLWLLARCPKDRSWLEWVVGLQVYTGSDSLVVHCLIADRGDLLIGSFSPRNLYSQVLFYSLLFEVPSCWVFGLLITSCVDALIVLHCKHGQPSSCSSFISLNSATWKTCR